MLSNSQEFFTFQVVSDPSRSLQMFPHRFRFLQTGSDSSRFSLRLFLLNRNLQDSLKFFNSIRIVWDPYKSFQIPADSDYLIFFLILCFRFFRFFLFFRIIPDYFDASGLFQIFRSFSGAFKDTVKDPQDSFNFFSSIQIISDPYRSLQIFSDSLRFSKIFHLSNRLRPFQILSNFSTSLQILPDFPKFLQICSNSFIFYDSSFWIEILKIL